MRNKVIMAAVALLCLSVAATAQTTIVDTRKLIVRDTLKLKIPIAAFTKDAGLSGNSDANVPTEKAVKSYADTKHPLEDQRLSKGNGVSFLNLSLNGQSAYINLENVATGQTTSTTGATLQSLGGNMKWTTGLGGTAHGVVFDISGLNALYTYTAPSNSGTLALTSDVAVKANSNGSNATGTWPISITGNAGTWCGHIYSPADHGSNLTYMMGYNEATNHWSYYTPSETVSWLQPQLDAGYAKLNGSNATGTWPVSITGTASGENLQTITNRANFTSNAILSTGDARPVGNPSSKAVGMSYNTSLDFGQVFAYDFASSTYKNLVLNPNGGNVIIGGNSTTNEKVQILTGGNRVGLAISGNTASNVNADLSITRSSSNAGTGQSAAIQLTDETTGNGYSYIIQGGIGGLQFFNSANVTGSNWIERMRLLPDGRFGIGTATPASGVLLDVNGKSRQQGFQIYNPGGSTNGKGWEWAPVAGTDIMNFNMLNDAGGVVGTAMNFQRSGTTLTGINLGGTWLSIANGAATFNGRVAGADAVNDKEFVTKQQVSMEYGSWTPVLAQFNGAVADAAACKYQKVGKMITLSYVFNFFNSTTTPTPSSDVVITGIPYAGQIIGAGAANVANYANINGSNVPVTVEVTNNVGLKIRYSNTNNYVQCGSLIPTTSGAGTVITGTITYLLQ